MTPREPASTLWPTSNQCRAAGWNEPGHRLALSSAQKSQHIFQFRGMWFDFWGHFYAFYSFSSRLNCFAAGRVQGYAVCSRLCFWARGVARNCKIELWQFGMRARVLSTYKYGDNWRQRRNVASNLPPPMKVPASRINFCHTELIWRDGSEREEKMLYWSCNNKQHFYDDCWIDARAPLAAFKLVKQFMANRKDLFFSSASRTAMLFLSWPKPHSATVGVKEEPFWPFPL